MYRVSKNLSNELKAIKSKSAKVSFTIEYISKLVDKRSIKALEDGELDELICIIDSSMKLGTKQQKAEGLLIFDALIAEETKRLDKVINASFFGKLKKKILKFIRSYK